MGTYPIKTYSYYIQLWTIFENRRKQQKIKTKVLTVDGWEIVKVIYFLIFIYLFIYFNIFIGV